MDKTTEAVPTSTATVHRMTLQTIKIPSKTGWSSIFVAGPSALFNLAPQAGHVTGGFSSGNCFSQSGHFIWGRLIPSLIHDVRLVESRPGRELKKICRHHLKRCGAFRFLIPSRDGGQSCAATLPPDSGTGVSPVRLKETHRQDACATIFGGHCCAANQSARAAPGPGQFLSIRPFSTGSWLRFSLKFGFVLAIAKALASHE